MAAMPTPSCSIGCQDTPFQRAVEDYIKGLPEKKRKRKFIVDCQRCLLNGSITADTIHESIKLAEEKNSKRTSKRIIRNALGPVVNVLKDYAGIIDALVSADPMPTAIIWGALKVIIDGADRFLSLFETIKNELRSLTSHLQRITEYEWLYGDSHMLQELLYKSYINILRFWSRIDKECDRCCFNSFLRATTSFSTDKLSKIIDDIKTDADEIQKLAPIIEARKAKGERENNELERFQAGLHRLAEEKDRHDNAEWREQQKVDRQVELYRQVCSWLCSQEINLSNQRILINHQAQRLSGTCDWLLSNFNYLTWVNGSTKPSIIWLRAHPGCGKSTITSHVIHSIQESDPKSAVAFHFYQWDNRYSAIEILRLLADQLFEKYWNCSHLVSEELHLKTQKTSNSLENIQDIIKILIKDLPKTYFILDGLDEENEGFRWIEARKVLDFLVQLSLDSPESVRVWYSSQDRPFIQKKLGEFIFDINDQVGSDVTYYISRRISELDGFEVSEEEKAGVLEKLKGKAEGNFLWASLMVNALTDEVSSLKEMKKFVQDGLPSTLDGYYRRIFDRFENHHRSLASKMFAMIAFARRPLRLKEIREAIGLLQANNPESPDDGDMPFTRSLRKLFAPLIEIQNGSSDQDDCTCRLFHSTVRDFLLKYPEVLNDGAGGPNLRISPYMILNACLLYLSQARYQKLLVRHDTRWVDASGDSVDRHHFLLYSAKYWDKHLDDVPETDMLRARVQTFLTSPNFLTCIQSQSLWVEGQFHVFYRPDQPDTGACLRRIFPTWFASQQQDWKLWKDFRAFMHEWRYFLQCGSCENPKCQFLPYAGEIDRCFWQALGSRNFMSKFEGRYTSFTFQNEKATDHMSGQCYEGISASGDELRLVRLVSRSQGTLEFVCEYWCLSGSNLPVLRKTQSISTNETDTNWLLYVKYSGDDASMRAGRAIPVSFSSDCQLLRIGSQVFAEDDFGNYVKLVGPTGMNDPYPPYIEEFTGRGRYVIVASRRVVTQNDVYESGIGDTKVADFGTDFTRIEEILSKIEPAPVVEKGSDDDGDDEDDEDEDDDADSESSFWSSADPNSQDAYETWSECSTDEEDVQFEDDLITPWTGRVGSPSKSGSEDTLVSEDGTHSESEGKSESSEPELSPSAVIGYGGYRADTSSDDECFNLMAYDSDGDGGYVHNPYRERKSSTGPHASITVFDTSTPVPANIFHFTRTLPFLLYGSPPAIHPSKPLIAWPLSSGDVMFTDFVAKTYFVRRLRPSTTHTRHIFMKCHFSSCGRYLHMASLEGQQKPDSGRKKKKKEPTTPPLKLALLILTYRLSGRKTTRSPPRLINLSRINLGTIKSLSVSRLPFTLTWTPEELYITCSDVTLRVYRIRLFRVSTNENILTSHDPDVLVPQKVIFLPNTAGRREVYFFPPGAGNATAQVVIGSETRPTSHDKVLGLQTEATMCATDDVIGLRGTSSLPIGCYLKETDLGGWTKCKDLSELPQDLGIGKLDRRLERFNPDDDCDLEPYIF